jgi:hypothetical protein
VREKYEQSKYYCQIDDTPGISSGGASGTGASRKTYFVHFVDYLGSNAFRRI